MFLNGGVESLMVFPQSSYYCLIAITPCLLVDLMQISSIDCFFFGYVFVSSSMPLMVDHVIGVVVVGSCDQPIIICTSLSKSTITTPSASIVVNPFEF